MIEYRASGKFPCLYQQFIPTHNGYPTITIKKSKNEKIFFESDDSIVVYLEEIISRRAAINTLSLIVDNQVTIIEKKGRRKRC